MTTRATRIARNFAILSASQIASRALAFGVTVYLTRVLHAEGYGLVVFATGLLLYASLIVDFGFQGFGPIVVAREKYPLLNLVQGVIGLRTALTLLAFLALGAFLAFTQVSILAKIITLLYGLSLITDAFDLRWVFLGRDDMRLVALTEVMEQVVLLIGVLLLIDNPANVILMPFVFLASRIASVVVLLTDFARTFGWPWPQISFGLIRSLQRETLPFAATSVIGNLLSSFDIVLIGIWLGLEAAGLYGAAYRIVWVFALLFSAYLMAQRPVLARGYVEGFESVQPILRRSIRLILVFSVGLLVGGVIVARPLLTLLFGDDFADAAAPLQLLLAATAILLVNRQYRSVLANFNQQSTMFMVMATGAVFNVAFNLLLIRPWGLQGAASATLISETVILALAYVYTRKLVGFIPMGRYLIKPLTCAVVMALIMFVAAPLHLILRIMLGAGVYLTILFLWGGISRYDLQLLFAAIWPSAARSAQQE